MSRINGINGSVVCFISWVIDASGKLTVSNVPTGDHHNAKYEIIDGYLHIIHPWHDYKDQIITAEVNLTSMPGVGVADFFFECSNLESVSWVNFNTAGITNLSGMFWGCDSLASLDLSGFDTSTATNMESMFHGCRNLADLNLSSFDTGSVTNMKNMFNGCERIQDLNLSSFSTSNVTNMSGMFRACNNLPSLDVSSFDTENVTDMSYMFDGCGSLVSLAISNFNTSKTGLMVSMFQNCNSLTHLDVSNFDASNVWNMDYMFSGCRSLRTLDLSNFNLRSVSYEMKDLLTGCTSLETIRTPYGMGDLMSSSILPIILPVGSDDFVWLMPDGSEITALPCNLKQSILLTQYKNPRIITETRDLNMSDVIRVKYVPYSYTVETNNWDPDNIVTYSIEKGTLARGLQMYPATGEIYGMPLEAGEFPITVKATFSNPRYLPSYKDLTLTVLDNTDSNVWNASDPGYEVEQYVGTLVSGSCPVLTELTDQLFVSTGAYREFIDFWLNGEKLVEGEDYTKEEGSTRITIRSQTFKEKADKNGVNTIAAEFRVGGDTGNALKRTAQNFRIKEQANNNSGGTSDTSGSSGSGSRGNAQHTGNTAPSPALQATAVVRLSTPSGAPLSGILVELHSTPMEAVTDTNGAAIFNGVEGGWHTLYVKDANGTLLASKGFELLFGERESMEGDRITAKVGEPFTLAVRMEGDKLTFIPVEEMADVQENKAPQAMQAQSATTGDSADPCVWFALFVSCGLLLATLFWRERKRQIR